MSHREHIESLLDRVKESWREMYEHWPYSMKSTGSEHWGTLALSHALQQDGWLAFPEVGVRRARLDLIAVNIKGRKWAIAVECKTFFARDGKKSSRVKRVMNDARRLVRAKQHLGNAENGSPLRVETTMVLVVNWSKNRRDDWEAKWASPKAPKGYRALRPITILPGDEKRKRDHLSLLAAICE